MQCGFCHMGCHYETKQNVLVTKIHQTLTNSNTFDLKIYYNCHIDKIDYYEQENGICQRC